MLNLRRTVDRLFDNVGSDGEWSQPSMWGLAVDVVENQDEFIVKASVPGINPDDLRRWAYLWRFYGPDWQPSDAIAMPSGRMSWGRLRSHYR